MIGVDGKFALIFSIGNRDDFLAEQQFEKLVVVEEAGGALPTFACSFWIEDDEIIKYFNEGQELKISLGADTNSLEDSYWMIARVGFSRLGDSKRRCYLAGFLNKPDYLVASIQRIIQKKNSSEALKEVLAGHFEFKDLTPTTKSDDKQVWIQPNISNKRFVTELWMHMHLKDSFPLIAIQMNEVFSLASAKDLFEQDTDWTFGFGGSDAIPVLGNFAIESQNGFINGWTGYSRKRPIIRLETSDEALITTDVKPFLNKNADKLNRQKGVGARVDCQVALTDNMNAHYWEALNRNLIYLALCSTYKVKFHFLDMQRDIHPLHMIEFGEDALPNPKKNTSFQLSGAHVVTKVARTISMKNIGTIVEACRDVQSDLDGKLQ